MISTIITSWPRTPSRLIHRLKYSMNSHASNSYLSSFTAKSIVMSNNNSNNSRLVGREIDLLDMKKDMRFRLPGNVGIYVNEAWLSKIRDLDDGLTCNKSQNVSKTISISPEELVNQLTDDKPMPNTDYDNFFEYDSCFDENGSKILHCEAHECPMLLVKDFQELFPQNNINLSNGLTVLTITHKTKYDMTIWSNDVINEREKLLDKFVATAEKMCTYLKGNGYWADFVDPSSGRPYYGDYTPATFFETDERYRRFGFEIEDLGCCKVLMHKRWGTNAFVGALFTNASRDSDVVQRLVVSLDD